MSNHKFERKYDRRIVLDDEKKRIIDLSDFHQQPPDVGIYDEPVRYFKANKLWCEFIFGWLTWMQSVSFWAEAEDSNYHAIQQMLIFEEGIEGGIFMTPDEFKQALYEGLYKWTNDVAKQVVSGGIGGFSVDEDGNVIPDSDSPDSDLPEDDPETPQIDESLAAKAGGIATVFAGLQEILTNMFNWFASYTPPSTGVIEQQAAKRLELLYGFSQELAEHFANYWYTVYINSSGAVTLDSAKLRAKLFCVGLTKQAISEYVYEDHATAAEVPVLEVFITDLPEAQLDTWFNRGLSVPSSVYADYPCVPIPPFVFNNLVYGAAQFTPQQKAFHRLLVKVQGHYDDPDGDLHDLFWYKTASGVFTFAPGQNVIVYGSGVTLPTSSQVPYRADHSYEFTIDIPALDAGFLSWQINRPAGMAVGSTSPTNGFQFQFEDLGGYNI